MLELRKENLQLKTQVFGFINCISVHSKPDINDKILHLVLKLFYSLLFYLNTHIYSAL